MAPHSELPHLKIGLRRRRVRCGGARPSTVFLPPPSAFARNYVNVEAKQNWGAATSALCQ